MMLKSGSWLPTFWRNLPHTSSGLPDYAPPEECNLHKHRKLYADTLFKLSNILLQHICKIKTSYKDSSLQTCSTMQTVKVTNIFKDHGAFIFQYGNTLPATITHFGLLDPENEGTMMLWNGGNYLPIAMVQHPSRFESSGTTLLSQAQQNHSVNNKRITFWAPW